MSDNKSNDNVGLAGNQLPFQKLKFMSIGEASRLFEIYLDEHGSDDINSQTLRKERRDLYKGDVGYTYFSGITKVAFKFFCEARNIVIRP